MGPAEGEITFAKSLTGSCSNGTKMFKDAYKNNPKIVDQMTKALEQIRLQKVLED